MRIIILSVLCLTIFNYYSHGSGAHAVPDVKNNLQIQKKEKSLIPKIDGEWWTIAGNPDHGR